MCGVKYGLPFPSDGSLLSLFFLLQKLYKHTKNNNIYPTGRVHCSLCGNHFRIVVFVFLCLRHFRDTFFSIPFFGGCYNPCRHSCRRRILVDAVATTGDSVRGVVVIDDFDHGIFSILLMT